MQWKENEIKTKNLAKQDKSQEEEDPCRFNNIQIF